MRIALGFKSHSGWAALVAVGANGNNFEVIDRRRIELIEEGELWAKMPFHAAEELEPEEANELVKRGVESAHKVASERMREIVERLRGHDYEIAGCGVLVPDPMPDWTTADILAVHFRMHKAEGVLFPDALGKAAEACGLPLTEVPEKRLAEYGDEELTAAIKRLGKEIGPPWAKDQRNAALAAMIALTDAEARAEARA
jgi:hypothetical protein